MLVYNIKNNKMATLSPQQQSLLNSFDSQINFKSKVKEFTQAFNNLKVLCSPLLQEKNEITSLCCYYVQLKIKIFTYLDSRELPKVLKCLNLLKKVRADVSNKIDELGFDDGTYLNMLNTLKKDFDNCIQAEETIIKIINLA
jgi:hypothetical protein